MTFIEYFSALGILIVILAPTLYVSTLVFFWFTDRDDRKYYRAMFKHAENQIRAGELTK